MTFHAIALGFCAGVVATLLLSFVATAAALRLIDSMADADLKRRAGK